jgi:hypothetical protein
MNEIGNRFAKWALVIGVPTAVCVAAYLVYRQQQDLAKKSATRRLPLPTPLTNITSSVTKAAGDASDNRVKVRMKFQFNNFFQQLFRIV